MVALFAILVSHMGVLLDFGVDIGRKFSKHDLNAGLGFHSQGFGVHLGMHFQNFGINMVLHFFLGRYVPNRNLVQSPNLGFTYCY